MKSALFLILSSILLVLGLVFVNPAYAQSLNQAPSTNTQYPNSGLEISTKDQVNPATVTNTNPDVPNNLHNWTQTVMIEVSSALTCQIIGVDPASPNGKCLGVDPKTGKIGFVENGGGAIGVLGTMMASLYEIPVHTGDYTNYLANNFGGAKKIYAATPCIGIGFCGLSPLLPIWETFRNIVYLIFVLIFMGIGIAIMLRVHIDPRTVMTIENQIPKLIIGILLVTFSYAIAGFLIDVMYIIIYLFFGVLSSVHGPQGLVDLSRMSPGVMQQTSAFAIGNNLNPDPSNNFGIFSFASNIAGTMQGVISQMFGINTDIVSISPVGGILDVINSISNTNGGANFVTLLLDFIAAGIASPIAVGWGGITEGIVAQIPILAAGGPAGFFLVFYTAIEGFLRYAITFGLPFLIILIATLWALFKLWLSLIQAYVFLMVDVATAPFWLVFGLLPGGKGFSLWFRDIIANIAVFPTAMIMLMLGDIFIQIFSSCSGGAVTATSNPCQSQFVPPLIGFSPGTPIIGALLAVGTILSTPEIVKQTRAVLKAPELNFKSVGQAIAKGVGTPQKVITTGAQAAFGTHYDNGVLTAKSGPVATGLRALGIVH